MKLSLVYFSLIFALTEIIHSQQVYYPLTIGNKWEYEGFLLPAEVIKDTVMPNQIEYSFILYASNDFEFLRQEGNKIYQYNRFYQQEELLYDFSKFPGDTIFTMLRTSDTTDIILRDIDSIEIFGKERLHFVFYIDHMRQAIDDEQVIEIVDSIGPSVRGWAWGFSDLVRAWIDGKYYETVNAEELEMDFSFSLNQNYPNPFNGITTISFSILSRMDIALTIYDVLGRKISEIVNKQLEKGDYKIRFDSKGLSSGVYFYELRTKNFKQVKKMLLLQ